jgi:hypothetical protein
MRAADRLRFIDQPFSWIWSFQKHSERLAAVRRLLARNERHELRRLDDDAVLKSLEEKLRKREILAYVTVPERGGGEHSDATPPADFVPAFPLEERSSPGSGQAAPPADPGLFPEDAALAEIAQTMKRAAESGVPFCEECLKAAIMEKHGLQ